jgi:pseudomonalisin
MIPRTRRSLTLLSLLILGTGIALAQTPDFRSVRPAARITRVVDETALVARPGNVHPMARAEFDNGLAPADTRMDRMILLLKPDAAQESVLETLLAAQQDPQSPEYRRWLTPEEFGERFGASESDINQLVAWLTSRGFQVEPTPASHRQIVFSGTAGQVRSAFHTEVHVYNTRTERHYANAQDPSIPEAFADVVAGVVSLNDFQSLPMHRGTAAVGASPEFTSGASHYLSPSDFATIYDAAGLYTQSIDGTGQSVAVAGRSNLNLSDVQNFRSTFGLPSNDPTVIVNGTNPGVVSTDEQTEATLDVEWSGATAPKASIQFVVSASTNTSDGVTLSSQYIVNHNLAPVMTLSFGNCEAAIGSAGNQFWNSLWQQAAAQGITVLVAAGDSGAAGCDSPSSTSATGGAGVNGLCSSPYSTCVGGTQFADTANPTAYWSASNSSTFGSALSYIPETTWNQSGTVGGGSDLWAGGGGASQVYTKPSWQNVSGVPADGHRDVPDVSLTASTHDAYIIEMNGSLYAVGGTSAPTPALGGLMSLAVQKTASRLGNANPELYALAASQASAGAAVFHDVISGNNSVPGQTGFNANAGYDLVTGLGSVDVALLVNNWGGGAVSAPAFQLSSASSSVSFAPGGGASVSLNVSGSGGFNSAVTFSTGTLPSGLTAVFTPAMIAAPGSGSSTLKLTSTSALAPGTYNLSITASGGTLSHSVPLTVIVQQTCSYTLNPTNTSVGASGGIFSFNVTTQAGCVWSAATSNSWVTLASPSSGTGSGKINFTVAANSTTSVRNGGITLGGVTETVSQAAGSASYSLNPTSANVAAGGGNGSVALTVSPSTAPWTAATNASWITITSAKSGSGSATVSYSVSANSTSSARTGTLTIAGLTFTVNQAGASSACSYQLSLGPVTSTRQGFVGTVSVATGAGCKWTAASQTSWLSITAGASDTGSGTASYLAAPNTSTSSRTGTLLVAGYTINLTEGGAPARSAVRVDPPTRRR